MRPLSSKKLPRKTEPGDFEMRASAGWWDAGRLSPIPATNLPSAFQSSTRSEESPGVAGLGSVASLAAAAAASFLDGLLDASARRMALSFENGASRAMIEGAVCETR